MATRNEIPGDWVIGRGMARPSLAYVVIVMLGTWAFIAVEDVRSGGGLAGAPAAAIGALIRFGLGGLAFVAVLLVPALVLAVELVHRLEAASPVARSLVGAAAWSGWCLFIALTLVVASRAVPQPESLASAIGLFAASGAAFSLLAFGGSDARPGRVLTLLALVVTVLVVLGSAWMAGRWGALISPAAAI